MSPTLLQNSRHWAEDLLGLCDLGDKRRTYRAIHVTDQMSRHPDRSISAAFDTEADRLAAHRWIENDDVDPEALREGAFAATAQQARACRVLLAPTDTTVVAYSHAAAAELGDIGGPAESPLAGWLVHSALLIDADSDLTVGLIDQDWWLRDPKQRGKSQQRGKRAYKDKESYKWERTSERIAERMGDQIDKVIELCDAESDVYNHLYYKVRNGRRFVLRVAQNRSLADDDQLLWDHLAAQPEAGRTVIDVPQKGGRPARQATLALRSMHTTLRPPNTNDAVSEPVEIGVVLAEEVDPPEGVEPQCWRLYTSEPIDTFEQVHQVVQYYARRWRIEEFHKSWKAVCKLEERRQQTADNLQRLGQVLAFVAVRLMQLREHARYRPDEPCTKLVRPLAWKYLWKELEKGPLPSSPPSAHWLFYAIARLGGFYDSKRTGRVGLEPMFRGWRHLIERMAAHQVLKSLDDDL